MRRFSRFSSTFALIAAGLLAATSAAAQTCASPTPVAGSQSGNTCAAPTGTGTNSIGTFCGATTSTENEIVYGPIPGNFPVAFANVTNVQPGFNVALVLLQASDVATCLAANNCAVTPADSAGAGGNESLSFSGVPAGTYYLVVTGSSGSGSCGSFTLAVMNVPVTLQQFSID